VLDQTGTEVYNAAFLQILIPARRGATTMPEIYDQVSCSGEFADNPGPRCACVLHRDTSLSMAGQAIAMDTLPPIAVRDLLKLRGLAVREPFKWLSSSLASVSWSNPGELVALPPLTSAQGWAVAV
jgi:hypothetical protein